MLSVVSIAYNNLEGLKRTLQIFTGKPFGDSVELVVVDGGSKDGTAEFLQSSGIADKWVSEKDKGIYNAMNKGLSMCSGDYVWFLNSGDYAESVAVVNAILETLKTSPDSVYGETMMVDEHCKPLGTRSEISTRKLPAALSWRSFRYGMNVGHQSFIIRRSLALPYDESLRHVADIDWMIRCLKQCRQNVRLDRVIACFVVDGYSSQNRKVSNRERFNVLSRHYGLIPNILAHIWIVIRKLILPGRV